jgi:acetyltransferase-like isoleucine patch superfamily enzyme
MNKPVIFFGVSVFAKMLYTLSKDIKELKVKAFMADDEYCSEEIFCGLPVWKSSMIDSKIVKQYVFLICVGYKNMRSRQTIYEKLLKKGCQFVNFIYPTVTILPEVQIGVNNIFLSDVTIENDVQIGNNNVFWTQTLICHNSIIGNHNFFAPGTIFAGNSMIGNLCFFGVASFAINNLRISDETYLIAGGGLFYDTEKSSKYQGNPAIKVGSHETTGIIIR